MAVDDLGPIDLSIADEMAREGGKVRRWMAATTLPCVICRQPTLVAQRNAQGVCSVCVRAAVNWHRADNGLPPLPD